MKIRVVDMIGLPLALALGWTCGAWQRSKPLSETAGSKAEKVAAPQNHGKVINQVFSAEQEWLAKTATAAEQDLPAFLQKANSLSDAWLRSFAREAVLRRWMTLDLVKCREALLALKNGSLLALFGKLWVAGYPQDAQAWILQKGKEQPLPPLQPFCEALAESDGGWMIEHWSQLPPEWQTEVIGRKAFFAVAKSSPYEAIKALGRLENQALRQWAVSSLAESWGQRDPAAALQWVNSLTAEAERTQATAGVLKWLTLRDPVMAEKLMKESALPSASLPWHLLVRSANRLGVEQALTQLQRIPSELRTATFYREILASYPTLSAEQIVQLTDRAALSGLGSQAPTLKQGLFHYEDAGPQSLNPEGDLRQLLTLDESPAKTVQSRIYAQQLATQNPQAAEALLAQATGAIKDSLAVSLATRAAKKIDLDLYQRVIGSVPEDLRSEVAVRMSARIAEESPQQAYAFADAQGEAQTRSQARAEAMSALAKTDFATAQARLSSHSETEPSEWRSFAESWAKSDAYAASKWLAEQSPGIERDHSVQGLVSSLASKPNPADLGSALAWARSIQTSEVQQKALRQIFGQWSSLDALQAREQFQQTPLPSALREALLSALPKLR